MGVEPPLSFLISLHSQLPEKKIAFIENCDTIISGTWGASMIFTF
jgi:hypothetical protein